MIGLPGETDADVHGIADTVERLRFEMRDIGRLELNLTISNFTPKPHTLFQWHSVSTAEFKRKGSCASACGCAFKGQHTDVRLSAMSIIMQTGAVPRSKPPASGAGMDAWFDNIERTHGAWCEAIEAAGLGGRYRELELGSWPSCSKDAGATPAALPEPLPWDHIDSGVSKQWLQEDLERALEAVVVPDCSFDGRSHCGVCGEGLDTT